MMRMLFAAAALAWPSVAEARELASVFEPAAAFAARHPAAAAGFDRAQIGAPDALVESVVLPGPEGAVVVAALRPSGRGCPADRPYDGPMDEKSLEEAPRPAFSPDGGFCETLAALPSGRIMRLTELCVVERGPLSRRPARPEGQSGWRVSLGRDGFATFAAHLDGRPLEGCGFRILLRDLR